METETMRVHVTTRVSNLLPSLGFTYTTDAISINLQEETHESLQDPSGIRLVTSSSSPTVSPILLRPRSFTPLGLSRLLRHHNIPFHRDVAQQISLCRFSRTNIYRPTPFLMSVNVKVIKEVRLVLLPSFSVSPSDGAASVDVFQRLLEEQSVQSSSQLGDDTTCSICIDHLSLSESESDSSNIIRMPQCQHLFHQNCIFDWLSRHNSCPLCRRVPYHED